MDRRLSIMRGIWASPKLLSEAKNNENERRLRVSDAARPGPMGRASSLYETKRSAGQPVLWEIVMFLRSHRRKNAQPWIGGHLSCGGLGPPKLVAEDKSDENERRLRVGDLSRSVF